MKSQYLKLNLVALLTIFLFVSCETTDEIIGEQSAALTSDDITAVEEVDMVMEEVTNTAEQAFVEEEVISMTVMAKRSTGRCSNSASLEI